MTKRRPLSGTSGTPEALAAARGAQQARQQEQEVVRLSAGKWQVGLAGLLALITGAAGIGLRDHLRKIEDSSAVWVGVLLSLALMAAGAALLMALHASGGLPRLMRTKNAPLDLAHLDAKSASSRLRFAVYLAMGSLLVLLAGNWVFWMAPDRSTEESATISYGTSSVCGTTQLVGERVLVTTPDKHVVPIELSAIGVWTKVDRCP